VLVSLALNACPQVLKDDFVVASGNAAASGTAATSGGPIGIGGSQVPRGGNAGTGAVVVVATGGTRAAGGDEAGGSPATEGGSAGNADDGGSETTGGDGSTGGADADVAGSAATGGDEATGGAGADIGGSAGDAGANAGRGASAGRGAAGATAANTGGFGGGGGSCVYGPFGAPKKITGFTVTGELWGSGLSSDASTLYFNTYDGTTEKIYSASRPDRGTAFTLDGTINLGTRGVESNPYPSSDGLTLYFVWAAQESSNDRDIWFARRSSTAGQFSNPQALTSVNTTFKESRAWLSRDELTILFESDRSFGKGGLDIWIATRKVKTDDLARPRICRSSTELLRMSHRSCPATGSRCTSSRVEQGALG
jgi:hypothetical protein